MNNDNSKDNVGNTSDNVDNVIDMTSRIQEPEGISRMRNLKVRFDLEQNKVAVSTSLLSIVILVTLANNNLLTQRSSDEEKAQLVSERVVSRGSRGIASVPAVTTPQELIADNPELVQELANRDLGPNAKVGRPPTQLEKLRIEYNSYAISLHNGKLREIALSEASPAKELESAVDFLAGSRELLPEFERSFKLSDAKEGVENVEIHQLVNRFNMPIAKVQFRTDDRRGLLLLRVLESQIAANK